MPELKCTVQTCVHNKQFLCDLDAIQVGGDQAKTARETCCDSFQERKANGTSNSSLSSYSNSSNSNSYSSTYSNGYSDINGSSFFYLSPLSIRSLCFFLNKSIQLCNMTCKSKPEKYIFLFSPDNKFSLPSP